MNPVTRYSALFLLLLFIRVMVPDAVILSLHHHAHTEHADTAAKMLAKVEKGHTHCPVDKLFETPFQGTCQPAFFILQTQPFFTVTLAVTGKTSTNIELKKLRGPPVA